MNLSRARELSREATTDESMLRRNTRVYKSWPLWAKVSVPVGAVLLLAGSIPKDGSAVASTTKATLVATAITLRGPAAARSQTVSSLQGLTLALTGRH